MPIEIKKKISIDEEKLERELSGLNTETNDMEPKEWDYILY